QRNGELEIFSHSKVVFESQSAPTIFVDNVVYRLYFKGLVSDEIAPATEGGKRTAVAGFGVAICDETGKLLFELKEPARNPVINRREVEIRALIRGLSESLDLGIRNVVIYCKDCEIYQNITGRSNPKEKGVLQVLAEEVGRLRKKFDSSQASLVARNDIKFVYKLAREAVVSQTRSADGEKSDANDDDGHDGDKHVDDDDHDDDDKDNNPWAYGCGCDCGFDYPSGGVDIHSDIDIDSYIDYYTL
ncbi:E3 ubiquitin-protein ligase RSL1, partial [Brassica napus]|uniref:E3 ubiquitin-protein ligase RSL1 n=1 Tax=Brassica napus TaxID=3708 RepID=UPI0006AAC627